MSRVVLTGASSGIGRAIALLLARDGHALVLCARREEALTSLSETCLVAGAAGVSVVAGDVSHADTALRLADAVRMLETGEIVVVNNAGVAVFGPFHEVLVEDSIGMVQVMVEGSMRVVHAVMPQMLAAGSGLVINVLSVAIRHTFAGAEGYTAAKQGLFGFAQSLSASYRGQGVRVTNIVPGAVDTPLWDTVQAHPDREEMLSPGAVAETVKFVIDAPQDRVYDEIVLTPPKGVL